MEGWGKIPLTQVAADGNLTQLYPTWVSAGSIWPGTFGQTIRKPTGGRLASAQVQTDGTNGGIIELWDICGLDIGADVSSLTAITNAQLVALQARGLAKLIWSMNFTSTVGAVTPASFPVQSFVRGLAARFVGSAGVCYLNLVAEGGYYKTMSAGST